MVKREREREGREEERKVGMRLTHRSSTPPPTHIPPPLLSDTSLLSRTSTPALYVTPTSPNTITHTRTPSLPHCLPPSTPIPSITPTLPSSSSITSTASKHAHSPTKTRKHSLPFPSSSPSSPSTEKTKLIENVSPRRASTTLAHTQKKHEEVCVICIYS